MPDACRDAEAPLACDPEPLGLKRLSHIDASVLFMVGSASLLSLVMVVGMDKWPEWSAASLTGSMLCAGAACWEPAERSDVRVLVAGAWMAAGLVALGIAVWQSSLTAPTSWIRLSRSTTLGWLGVLMMLMVGVSLLWSRSGPFRWVIGALLVAGFVAGTGWYLLDQKKPGIDVLMFQQRGGEAVLKGTNPYNAARIRLPDVYNFRIPERCLHNPIGLRLDSGPTECRIHFYDPSLTDSRTLKFGYPYTVVSLAGATLAQWIVSDSRWMQLLVAVVTVLLLVALGAGQRRWLQTATSVALFLSVAPMWRSIKFGFLEPIVIAAFAAVVFCALRRPRMLPYALGVLLASKQYVPLVLPLLPLLVPWATLRRRAFALPMIATAGLLSIPPLLLTGYWHSVWTVQLAQPFRSDSLSLAAYWVNHVDGTPPGTLFSFAPPLIAILLAYRVAPRTPSGFAAAAGFVFVVFFGFAKQAFANYHSLAIGLLCVAIAAYGAQAARPGLDIDVRVQDAV